MRKKSSKKNDDEFQTHHWLDTQNNVRDPDRLCEFIADLFETMDKLSKKKLFAISGGEQQFREHVSAAVSKFKASDKSEVSAVRLICYVYFRLRLVLWGPKMNRRPAKRKPNV